jgi:large subunit ribosomal protein L21
MYAVIKTGGKQHKVKAGDILEVEYLHADDDTLTFQPLLVVDDDGKTHVGKEAQQAVVTAKRLGEQKGDKVNVFKYKSKSGYSRRQGHRQLMTLIEISEVTLGGAKRAPRKKAAETAASKADEAAPAEADAPETTEAD